MSDALQPLAPQADDAGLDLERNLALMAGAGAGKTYSLVTICLHLLGGARKDGVAVRPAELCLLTFTEKAAGELRTRLRERLDALATRDDAELEPLLRASVAAHGRPFLPRDEWRRIRDDLGAATIGTFHSLCVQILRRAPAGFGVDPAFELLDEGAASSLVSDCAERVVLEALGRDDERVAELCRELTFSGSGRAGGLVDGMVRVLGKLREEGIPADSVATTDPAQARRDFDQVLQGMRASVSAAQATAKPELQGHLAQCARVLGRMGFESFEQEWPNLKAAANACSWPNARSEAGKALKAFVEGALGNSKTQAQLPAAFAACAAVVHEQALRGLISELEKRLDLELARRGVLDFSALLIRTRDLLRDHPAVRREVQERFRALLVDEFQDTNRLQLEIVTLLAEQREGGPRAVANRSGAALSVPLEPRFLCAVGDRKQSIYEFRGADVSVFEELAQKIEREGGRRGHLQRNRRSTPDLLSFFNGVFAGAMRPREDARDYEVAYVPQHDDLMPHRKPPQGTWGVERIFVDEVPELSEEARELDARAVATRIRALLASGAVIERRDGSSGPVRGGDIAILLRRFTFLEAYRQALVREGIPHRVVRGRGFYGAQEVLDLSSLLSLVADSDDGVSFAAVLRSPLVAVSDPSLLKLSEAAGHKLRLWPLLADGATLPALPPDEQRRLGRFFELYRQLRAERDRLGVRELLRAALDETGYRVAIAGTPFAEQALANVEKLLELASRWDAAPRGDLAAFSRELLELADAEPREAQADILDEADPRAVQILTIHQAKGLEWPAVFVPDLSAGQRNVADRILYERHLGLGLRGWLAGELEVGRSRRLAAIAGELSRREAAESTRLLYVALTRARDHLVLSGQRSRGGETWWKKVEEQLEGSSLVRGLVRDVPAEAEIPDGQASLELGARDATAARRAELAISRARSKAPPTSKAVVIPVTQLQDYSRCPRRYLYAHQLGLHEARPVFDVEAASEERSGPDPRERGTMAHRLLERADLSLVGAGRRLADHLEALLRAEGADPRQEPWGEVANWVQAFLGTGFARRLRDAGEDRVHRELPFLLRLDGEDGLAVHVKGQIDLLFEDEDGGATVVDYKASIRHPTGLDAYAFQLDCYALAARAFVNDGVPVRTGIAYLREEDPGPDMRAVGAGAEALERRLASLGAALLSDTRSHCWAGRERTTCEALGCGYRYRCHPQGRGL